PIGCPSVPRGRGHGHYQGGGAIESARRFSERFRAHAPVRSCSASACLTRVSRILHGRGPERRLTQKIQRHENEKGISLNIFASMFLTEFFASSCKLFQ